MRNLISRCTAAGCLLIALVASNGLPTMAQEQLPGDKPLAPQTQSKDQPSTPSTPPSRENPTDTKRPPIIFGHVDDCPQRGMGCAVLLIDFRRHAMDPENPFMHEQGNLVRMQRAFDRINCKVDYVAPDFTPIAGAKDEEQAKKQNNQQMIDIRNAVASHRQKLEQGREIAIEMIAAHGAPWNIEDGNFGEFGVHDGGTTTYGITERGDSNAPADEGRGRALLSRGLIHAGNYKAAFHKVCRWIVWDTSCASGLTARAVDTLNNTGGAQYTLAPIDNQSLHAGYEANVAYGSADASDCSHFGDDDKRERKIEAAIDNFRILSNIDQNKALGFGTNVPPLNRDAEPTNYRRLDFGDALTSMTGLEGTTSSTYLDHGYISPAKPVRNGYQFTPEPVDQRY